jgi:hypothetical protein
MPCTNRLRASYKYGKVAIVEPAQPLDHPDISVSVSVDSTLAFSAAGAAVSDVLSCTVVSASSSE